MPKLRVFRVLGEKPMEIVDQLLKLRSHRKMDNLRFFAVGAVILTIGTGESVTMDNGRQKQDIYFCFVGSLPEPPANRDFTKETCLAFTKIKGEQVVVHRYTTKTGSELVLAEIYEGEDGSCELATCPSQFMEVDAAAFSDRALAMNGIPSLDHHGPVRAGGRGH